MKGNKYITIQQLANMLGISRIAVYKRIKKGQIEAIKIGRNYAIPEKYISNILGKVLNDRQKQNIERAVKKTVQEYGEVLKLLGRA
jgi:excisionase family DNA binding protein